MNISKLGVLGGTGVDSVSSENILNGVVDGTGGRFLIETGFLNVTSSLGLWAGSLEGAAEKLTVKYLGHLWYFLGHFVKCH